MVTLDSKDLTFKIAKTSQTGTLFKIRNDIDQLTIPWTVKQRNVYVNTLYNFSFLTKVAIHPNSNLERIESKAFYNSQIKEICIPSTVTKIWFFFFFFRLLFFGKSWNSSKFVFTNK